MAINWCWRLDSTVAVALEGSLAERDVDMQQVRLEQEPWSVVPELQLENLLRRTGKLSIKLIRI